MITLNRFAPRILDLMRSRFHINDNTSKKAFCLKISAAWRRLDELSGLPIDDIKDHPEYKKRAADIIVVTIAFMKNYGCDDIEAEIRNIIGLPSKKTDELK